MKAMKYIVAAALMMCAGVESKAQDKVEGTVCADFVNQYIWRGQDLGNVSVQPTLGIGWKGLSLSAWGSVGLASVEDAKEFDLTLGYSVGGFNVGVTDYWFSEGSYFQYGAHATTHVFEGNVGYDLGFLSLQCYTNFGGADGVNKDGKRAYSTYLELNAPFKLGGCEWDATLGAVPMATDFYGTSGFAVTNVGLKATKTFSIGNALDIPVFTGVTVNPRSEKAYLLVGFSISPKL